jgi:hypothetical protein
MVVPLMMVWDGCVLDPSAAGIGHDTIDPVETAMSLDNT